MAGGPLEYLVVGFDGTNFRGEVVAALAEAQDRGIIKVLDLVLAIKDPSGDVSVLELDELDGEAARPFVPLAADITNLLSDTDIKDISERLDPNTAAGILVFEHLWADKLRDAIANADGHLIAGGLIPQEAADAARQGVAVA